MDTGRAKRKFREVALLGAQRAKIGAPRDVVRWRMFHRAAQDIRVRNADTDPAELQQIIDDTVREIRAEPSVRRRTGASPLD